MALSLEQLFENNKAWADKVKGSDPDFFLNNSSQQTPEYLWIGCSDSRVPANQIIDLKPGQVFVHRNIANVVVHTDLNCLSVMQFAVEHLNVKHIIVCGHYGCGGVKASMDNNQHGLIDNWLRHIQDVIRFHQAELDALEEGPVRENRLCELNVIEQVKNVCSTTVVQNAWARGDQLSVHGWVYGLHDGIIKDLGVSRASNS